MKNLVFLFVFIFINLSLSSLHYYSDDYLYSIDFPDNWEINDDSKDYNIFFRNDKKEAFAEVTIYDIKSTETLEELFDSVVKRYEMSGTNKPTTFDKYEAIRGTYLLNLNGVDLKMDIMAFKNTYHYYVIMGYANKPKFNLMRNELYEIIQSFKIYENEDNKSNKEKKENNNRDNIVRKRDNDTKDRRENRREDKKKEKEEEKDKDKEDTEKENKSGKEYYLKCSWDKYKVNYKFLESDYKKAVEEMNEIANPDIWSYYNIDTNQDSDYNFTFWSMFYQDVYNKNFYRVNEIVEWFKNEAKNKKWDTYALANNVMKAIQVIPYERPSNIVKNKKSAAHSLDYFTPNEVAWYNKGDCDTKSLFMVLILRKLGFDAVMYYSFDYGHAMVGLNINGNGTYKTYNNKKYYFIESTYPDWKIGDLPPDMNNTKKWRLIPIK